MSHRSIIILPEDTINPILNSIEEARHSLRIKLFIFSEPSLLKAVIDARKRGVNVKVMLNPSRSNGDGLNLHAKTMLEEAGVEVKDTNPIFKVSHEKSMVVDDRLAFVQSFNWVTRHLMETRDYCIVTSHQAEVIEITECFECDWERSEFNPGETAHLIWSRGNARARIARFIDSAKNRLFVQNDRYQDMVIIERLIRAKNRGVKVHVMSPPPHSLKKDKLVESIGGLRILNEVGIKIHNLHNHILHGKLLLADRSRAIIGSINLTTGSFDDRRELAIEVRDENIIQRLVDIERLDWKQSLPLDFSDKGLYDELENRGSGGSEKLVLDLSKKKK